MYNYNDFTLSMDKNSKIHKAILDFKKVLEETTGIAEVCIVYSYNEEEYILSGYLGDNLKVIGLCERTKHSILQNYEKQA